MGLYVPQADDLDKVFEVAEIAATGPHKAPDVAHEMEVVDRQAFYYIAAAEALQLIERDEDGEVILTKLGREYVSATAEGKPRLREKAILAAPIVKHIAGELGIKRLTKRRAYLLTDVAFVQDAIEKLGYSANTALRRAGTIRTWMLEVMKTV